MKKKYNGMKIEKICYQNVFEAETFVRVQSGCYSIMAYTQGPQGSDQWYLCQEAVEGGEDDNFGEWWLLPREIYI